MKFKTLEELQEHNKNAFKSVFGKITTQKDSMTDLDGLTYFERITKISQPHKVLDTSWMLFSSSSFSTRLLPKVKYLKGKGVHFFDGAELFNKFQRTPQKLLDLSNNNMLINVIAFSYPKGVEAEKKKNRVKAVNYEVVTFIEIDEHNNIEMFFKFGRNFKEFLKDYFNDIGKPISISSLEEKIYKTNTTDFQKHFDNTLSHDNMMCFVLKTIGIEEGINKQKEIFENFEKTFIALDDDFGAGRVKEKHPNAFAHGDIEDIALKNAGYTQNEIDQVYYGNWLRDFSQVIVADTVGFNKIDQKIFKKYFKENARAQELLPSMSCKPSQDTWLQIVNLLAVKEFIYNPKKKKGKIQTQNFNEHQKEFEKKFGKLTKDILGIYRPEEHLDNPKGLKDDTVFADTKLQNPIQFNYEFEKNKTKIKKLYVGLNANSLQIDDETLMKHFLVKDIKIDEEDDRPSTLTYLKEQLILAKQKGRNRNGLRHFGAALHIIEDYFAHTNFIEIALIKNGYTKVFPWVQLDNDIEELEDGKEKASKIPIVSGLFGSDDTIASITPKIAEELFPLGFQEYQSIKENERTFFDSLVTTVLEDLASKEQINTSNNCLPIEIPSWVDISYKSLLNIYNGYLSFRDWWASFKKIPFLGKALEFFEIGVHYLTQIVTFFSDAMFNILLNSIEEGIKEKQTRVNQNFGTDPTHTQIAKDPTDHPLNNLAGTLAVIAVTDIAKKMRSSWSGGLSIDYIIKHIEKNYFTHPKNTTWMDATIKDWARKNSQNIKIAESKTQIYHHQKQIKKTFEKYEKEIETLKNPPKKQ